MAFHDPGLVALVAHASAVAAAERAELAGRIRDELPPGAVLLETCHRTELYASTHEVLERIGQIPAGCTVAEGRDAADHLVGLAVGLRSTVVAEDQILHQLRTSIEAARSRGRLPSDLDRLFDLALRAGRRARSWLPPERRPSLADVAVDLVADGMAVEGREVLVVGAGEMGRLAVTTILARGGRPMVASRTPGRAVALAHQLRTGTMPFDPGPLAARRLAGVIVALRGPWPIAPETIEALVGGDAWVIDLSSPPSVATEVGSALGRRLITIDDLARVAGPDREHHLVQRLHRLAATTLDEYTAWLDEGPRRETARAMAQRADVARTTELDRLWERLPALGPQEREEIERMTRHLAERLLREPLERLGRDADGRQAQAARELFGL